MSKRCWPSGSSASPWVSWAHAPIALREGVSAAKVEAVKFTAICDVFDAHERQVLALTDAMTRDVLVRDVLVPDGLMADLQQQHDPQHLVELVATVAADNMVSRFLVALNVSH